MSVTPHLIVYGAAYGPKDVTGIVRDLIKDQSLRIQTGDHHNLRGDPWHGKRKSLVVVYRYSTDPATDFKVAIAAERSDPDTINITPPARCRSDTKHVWLKHFESSAQSKRPSLTVLGAAYGRKDVTNLVQHYAAGGVIEITATNEVFGDSWPGYEKTFVVVYKCNGIVSLDLVTEGNRMRVLACPSFAVLGAAYGPSDITKSVVTKIKNRSVHFKASNDTFGDTWHHTEKSAVVIYQYENEKPQVAIAKEGGSIIIDYQSKAPEKNLIPADPRDLVILGAVYGLEDVTAKVQRLVNDNYSLDFFAGNSKLGDSWPYVTKSFVVAYRYGHGKVQVKVARENEKVSIMPSDQFHYVDSKHFIHDGDKFALSALHHRYITCDDKSRLVASEDLPDKGCMFTVKKPSGSLCKLLADNGKYVKVGDDDVLYADASASSATEFRMVFSKTGGLHFAPSKGSYVQLSSDGILKADAPHYFGANCMFHISVKNEDMDHSAGLAGFSEYDIALATLIWELTGGLFVQIGLGPYILTGEAKPGFVALVKAASPRVAAAIDRLASLIVKGVLEHPAEVAAAVLAAIGVLYDEGLLWKAFKFMLKFSAWYIASWVIAKIIEIVFVPEAEAAEVLAGFIIWMAQTTEAAIAFINVSSKK